jgi:hypothetical protein
MTFMYGEPQVEDRKHVWELLHRIKDKVDIPWIVMGDFNEAMWQFEHFSNTRRGKRQMEDFWAVLEFCGLHYLGFSGLPWTFDNKRGGNRNVKVRLDRAVTSSLWLARFSDASIKHLISPCSDHYPVLMQLYNDDPIAANGRIRRYEIMWECEESLVPEITAAWEATGAKRNLGDISSALKEVMDSLYSWSKGRFGSIRKELESLRSKLENLQSRNDANDGEEIKRTMDRMDEILYREEMMWLQRSRVSCLKEGDRKKNIFI